jgi:proteasome lid subunit RPN8/RPN11
MRALTHAILPSRVLDEILAHARAAAPDECCGLLVGRDGRIHRSSRARNLDSSPHRYLIDPSDHFAAMRAARDEGLLVIGAYHSHPDGPAVPSPTDVSEAAGDSQFVYLIVSLSAAGAQAVGAYLLTAGGAEPLTLTIET